MADLEIYIEGAHSGQASVISYESNQICPRKVGPGPLPPKSTFDNGQSNYT